MFRGFLSFSAGVLALLCVTWMPGQLYAQHARGGFRPGGLPQTNRMSPSMNRQFTDPRFGGFIPTSSIFRPTGTRSTTVTHPTATSTSITTSSPTRASSTSITHPTSTTTSVTNNSNATFTNALAAFRSFSTDLRQFRPIVNGTTTVTHPTSTSTQVTTMLRTGGTATTNISHPTAGTTTVTNSRPGASGTTTLSQTASSATVTNSSSITFNDALQSFRGFSFNPSTFRSLNALP